MFHAITEPPFPQWHASSVCGRSRTCQPSSPASASSRQERVAMAPAACRRSLARCRGDDEGALQLGADHVPIYICAAAAAAAAVAAILALAPALPPRLAAPSRPCLSLVPVPVPVMTVSIAGSAARRVPPPAFVRAATVSLASPRPPI